MAFDGREGFADGAAVVFVDGDEGFVAAAVEEGFVAAAELVPGCAKFVKKRGRWLEMRARVERRREKKRINSPHCF